MSLIYPRRRTHSKYAGPWTNERVGRYSHSYITSYKLNFSSSPLFKLLQYFPSHFSWNCPRVKSVVRIYSTLFPQNNLVEGFYFLFEEMETQVRIWPSPCLRKNRVTMCVQWKNILSSTPCIQKQLRCVHVVFLQMLDASLLMSNFLDASPCLNTRPKIKWANLSAGFIVCNYVCVYWSHIFILRSFFYHKNI